MSCRVPLAVLAALSTLHCGVATKLADHLQITETIPSAGSMEISTATSFVVIFSDGLDEATLTDGTVQLLDGGGQAVVGTITYDNEAHSISFQPAADLAEGAAYELVIHDEVLTPAKVGLGGTAHLPYRTEGVPTDTGPIDDTATDTGTPKDDTGTPAPTYFEPTHLAVYYRGGIFAAAPVDVALDDKSTVVPEVVVALLESDDAEEAGDLATACQLVFDLDNVAIANTSGSVNWNLSWGMNLPAHLTATRGRCVDMDPAVWADPLGLLGIGDINVGFTPADASMADAVAARLGADWAVVSPYVVSIWVDLGEDTTATSERWAGFAWSYAILPTGDVVRDTDGGLVPQNMSGATAIPNGFYPGEAIAAFPL